MNSNNNPLVSVLITSYNKEKYIGSAIESVLRSIYKNIEVIISDDCSTDATVDIARRYESENDSIRLYVNKENLGDYNNRNYAASLAKGKYIKYLDADDIMYPHCIEVMVRCMEEFPEAGFGLSAVAEVDRPYPVCLSPNEAYVSYFLNGQTHFDRAPCSSIIKKSAFDEAGRFSGERMIGDYDLWLRMGMHFSLVKFPADLYWSRTHEGQESQSEYAKTKYTQLREMVRKRYLEDKHCPLSEEEKKRYYKQDKRSSFKKTVKSILKKL